MINSLITQIGNKEIVLPAIQRDFVWKEDRISLMFDSIMRGYPIGIILLWETYHDIQYREFDSDYHTEKQYAFKDNTRNRRIKLILDGQQRLQSLFIAIEGSLDNKIMFFDILSGKTADDFREIFYNFRFLSKEELAQINAKSKEIKVSIKKKKGDDIQDQDKKMIFYSVKEILKTNPEQRLRLKNDFKKEYNLTTEEEVMIELNMNKLIHTLTNDPNVLKVSIIDENTARDSSERKKESDILEAFVRINRQGIPLSRSDLVFSMLKLNWKTSSEKLPVFIKEINEGNNLDLDIDFVIRSLFAVSDLGSKFDVDLLRKKSNINKIKANYEKTCKAIKSLVDFLTDDCKILNSNILGGNLNLVPFVYYLSNTKNNLIPNSELHKVKLAIYLFGFTKPFSRYADSRIGRFIKDELKTPVEMNQEYFPLERTISWVNYWEDYSTFNSKVLNKNVHLTLHLVQSKSGGKFKYSRNAPEVDHIFPKSILEKRGFDYSEINSIGNFWILAKTKNQNKSNIPPKTYFEDVNRTVLKEALIDKGLLNYQHFRKFIKEREQKIFAKVVKKISLRKGELDYKVK